MGWTSANSSSFFISRSHAIDSSKLGIIRGDEQYTPSNMVTRKLIDRFDKGAAVDLNDAIVSSKTIWK